MNVFVNTLIAAHYCAKWPLVLYHRAASSRVCNKTSLHIMKAMPLVFKVNKYQNRFIPMQVYSVSEIPEDTWLSVGVHVFLV